MVKYRVLDKTTHFAQGENSFEVVDGQVEMPASIAADYVACGILELHKEAPAEKQLTAAEKKAAAKAAKAAAEGETE